MKVSFVFFFLMTSILAIGIMEILEITQKRLDTRFYKKEIKMEEEFTTTFAMDFRIADSFGVAAIKDTFNRAFKEWRNDYRYLTDLVIVLNHSCWRYYELGKEDYFELYESLYYKASDYALNTLKGEGLSYYFRKTD